MGKLSIGSIMALLVSQAAGCIITTSDDDDDPTTGAIEFAWMIPEGCGDADVAQLIGETPDNIELFNTAVACTEGNSGATVVVDGLADGEIVDYAIFIVNTQTNSTFGQSPPQTTTIIGGAIYEAPLEVISVVSGQFDFFYNIDNGGNDCSDFPGANVDMIAAHASQEQVISRIGCVTPQEGVSGPTALGTWQVSLALVDPSETLLGTSDLAYEDTLTTDGELLTVPDPFNIVTQ